MCHGNMHAHSTCEHIHDVFNRLSCIYVFVKWFHMRLCTSLGKGSVDIILNDDGLVFLKQLMLRHMNLTIRL